MESSFGLWTKSTNHLLETDKSLTVFFNRWNLQHFATTNCALHCFENLQLPIVENPCFKQISTAPFLSVRKWIVFQSQLRFLFVWHHSLLKQTRSLFHCEGKRVLLNRISFLLFAAFFFSFKNSHNHELFAQM